VAETGQPYAFTGDDPLNATDPLGLKGWYCIDNGKKSKNGKGVSHYYQGNKYGAANGKSNWLSLPNRRTRWTNCGCILSPRVREWIHCLPRLIKNKRTHLNESRRLELTSAGAQLVSLPPFIS